MCGRGKPKAAFIGEKKKRDLGRGKKGGFRSEKKTFF